MNKELKACECGSTDSSIGYEAPQCYWVECGDCGHKTAGESRRGLAIHAWNTRTQLPSQGGEAVATHLGWDFLDDGSRVATYFIRAPGEVAPKLYTHPADQVADDLTMVKVSRELANIAALHLENSGYTETGKKLRALLNGGQE